MSALVSALAVMLGVWSLTWDVSMITHVVVLALCGLVFWSSDIMIKPYSPCRYCDKGRTWDDAHAHFGEYCAGAMLGFWSCHGAGRKLRWELKVLRIFGVGSEIADPVTPHLRE